jgi:hypothetical protein
MEMVKRDEILNRELLPKRSSGTLEKLWARGSEDDVIDLE